VLQHWPTPRRGAVTACEVSTPPPVLTKEPHMVSHCQHLPIPLSTSLPCSCIPSTQKATHASPHLVQLVAVAAQQAAHVGQRLLLAAEGAAVRVAEQLPCNVSQRLVLIPGLPLLDKPAGRGWVVRVARGRGGGASNTQCCGWKAVPPQHAGACMDMTQSGQCTQQQSSKT
jgi:hypothetical protein